MKRILAILGLLIFVLAMLVLPAAHTHGACGEHACSRTVEHDASDHNDDDGETTAGAKLAALLELTGAQNVLVVVSRWFGGVLLGPARFKYIANTARALLDETGRCKPSHAQGRKGGKPSKAPSGGTNEQKGTTR